MDEFDDLDAYNGNTEHDMWVDFTYKENSAELEEYFDDEDINSIVVNIDDWD